MLHLADGLLNVAFQLLWVFAERIKSVVQEEWVGVGGGWWGRKEINW